MVALSEGERFTVNGEPFFEDEHVTEMQAYLLYKTK